MLSFYNEIPDMRLCAGDTLPVFNITVDTEGLENCTMHCIVTKSRDTSTADICKECFATQTGFAVQLTTSDTYKLSEGIHTVIFVLSAGGCDYIKLKGKMYVSVVARRI